MADESESTPSGQKEQTPDIKPEKIPIENLPEIIRATIENVSVGRLSETFGYIDLLQSDEPRHEEGQKGSFIALAKDQLTQLNDGLVAIQMFLRQWNPARDFWVDRTNPQAPVLALNRIVEDKTEEKS